ncbi:MAG: STAS domain-containing protein [Thermoleophilia bacterium]|jgi:anti-anti-sigma factor
MSTELSQDSIPRTEVEVAWLRLPRLPFAVRLERATKGITMVILQGEVDPHSVPRFRDAVAAGIDEGVTAIIVDLSDVSFIDASGLGVIVVAARH